MEEKHQNTVKSDTMEEDERSMNSSKAGEDGPSEDNVTEEEIELLEAEVKDLADKIIHLRRTVPSAFRAKLESLLVSMRPVFPQLQQQSFEKPTSSEVGSQKRVPALLATVGEEEEEEEEDQETAAQIALLKSKIAANVAAMPAILDRMKLCIEKMNKLDQYKGNIHHVFTRKLPSDG